MCVTPGVEGLRGEYPQPGRLKPNKGSRGVAVGRASPGAPTAEPPGLRPFALGNRWGPRSPLAASGRTGFWREARLTWGGRGA